MGHANTPAAFLTAATARGGAAPTPLPLPFILIQVGTQTPQTPCSLAGIVGEEVQFGALCRVYRARVGMVKFVEQALLMSEGVVG